MHCDEQHYLSELSTLIKEDPGNLSRELHRLEREGLFSSMPKGKLKFYALNKKYPLFRELRQIFLKSEGVKETLKALADRFRNIRLAFLYGAYAENGDDSNCCIDMVVVGSVDYSAFAERLRQTETRLGREINFTLYSPKEFATERENKQGGLHRTLRNKIVLLKGRLHD
jgi:DNA-binding transcriptional ArsR family regulator